MYIPCFKRYSRESQPSQESAPVIFTMVDVWALMNMRLPYVFVGNATSGPGHVTATQCVAQ